VKKKTRSHSSSQPKNLRLIGRSIVVVLAITVVIAVAMATSRFFTVQALSCQLTDASDCPAELQTQIEVLKNQPMFFTNYTKILSEKATVSQPYSLTRITKRLPNTLRATFSSEQPLLLLHQTGSYQVISTTGKAFPQTEETAATLTHLLLVETDQNLIDNNVVIPEFLSTMKEIARSTEEYRLPIDKITWVDKSTIRLSMKERQEQAIIDSESPAIELQRLFLILQSKEYQNLTESKQELDVRFTMPVLRTAQ
jgi:cell division septal protein FtsQ